MRDLSPLQRSVGRFVDPNNSNCYCWYKRMSSVSRIAVSVNRVKVIVISCNEYLTATADLVSLHVYNSAWCLSYFVVLLSLSITMASQYIISTVLIITTLLLSEYTYWISRHMRCQGNAGTVPVSNMQQSLTAWLWRLQSVDVCTSGTCRCHCQLYQVSPVLSCSKISRLMM